MSVTIVNRPAHIPFAPSVGVITIGTTDDGDPIISTRIMPRAFARMEYPAELTACDEAMSTDTAEENDMNAHLTARDACMVLARNARAAGNARRTAAHVRNARLHNTLALMHKSR